MPTTTKRFVFISALEAYPWGGCEELWSQAANRLLRAGHEVTASVAHQPGGVPHPKLAALAAVGDRLRPRPPFSRGKVRRLLRRRLPIAGIASSEAVCLASLLVEPHPDLVILSQGCTIDGVDWFPPLARSGVPYAVVNQAVGEFYWPDDAKAEAIGQGYNAARRCFFVSRHNLEMVQSQLGLTLGNAEVVSNPVALPDASAALASEYPGVDPTFKLACVARLDLATKGQDLLMRVLSREKWRGRNLAVTFYGTGQNAVTAQREARRLDLPNLTFAGHVGGAHLIWPSHHALVLPSRVEGLPLAILEAGFCARTAIVTNAGGNAEVIRDNETGFVAAAPEVNALDEALERAWARRGDWEEMGWRARDHIRGLIPTDPAQAFADKLLHLVGGSSPPAAHPGSP